MRPALVSIDPGVHSCAVVAWMVPTACSNSVDATLYAATMTRLTDSPETPLAVLDQIESWGFFKTPIIIEAPVKYPTKRSTHKDVQRLMDVVRAIRSAYPDDRFFEVTPHAWKGNTPKPIQASRILSALTKAEHDAITWPKKSLRHNVLDAIGIGLFRLGRLGRGSV